MLSWTWTKKYKIPARNVLQLGYIWKYIVGTRASSARGYNYANNIPAHLRWHTILRWDFMPRIWKNLQMFQNYMLLNEYNSVIHTHYISKSRLKTYSRLFDLWGLLYLREDQVFRDTKTYSVILFTLFFIAMRIKFSISIKFPTDGYLLIYKI